MKHDDRPDRGILDIKARGDGLAAPAGRMVDNLHDGPARHRLARADALATLAAAARRMRPGAVQ